MSHHSTFLQVITIGRSLGTIEEQHFAFVWFLVCKLIICVRSGRMTKDTKHITLALYSGVKSALASIVLTNCYKLMYVVVTQNLFSLVPGSSWLIQLRLFLYFSGLRTKKTRTLK